jgi:hypothetical protein
VLESSPTIGTTANWTTAPEEPTVDGEMYKVSVPVTGSAGYYRLKK